MADHEEELVTIYAIGPCDCSSKDLADENLHPEDSMGNGIYCVRKPTGTACLYCSEYADQWVDHEDIVEDEDEDEDEEVDA